MAAAYMIFLRFGSCSTTRPGPIRGIQQGCVGSPVTGYLQKLMNIMMNVMQLFHEVCLVVGCELPFVGGSSKQ
jgi:hypothetical protein